MNKKAIYNQHIRIRITDYEKEVLDKECKKRKMSMSELFRYCFHEQLGFKERLKPMELEDGREEFYGYDDWYVRQLEEARNQQSQE